ncbi:MAG: hypothetical protein AB8H86_18955 [Polyangiales bacterium]
MKWVRALPQEQGAYVVGMSKSYRVEHPWVSLGNPPEGRDIFRAAHEVLTGAGAKYGELWIQGADVPTLRGLWIPNPYNADAAEKWFHAGFWVTNTKGGQGQDMLDPTAMLLLGPGVITSRAALGHQSSKAAKSLVHLPEVEEHHFQRGRASKLSGEPYWDKYARAKDYVSAHTFTAEGLAHRFFSVDCSWARSLEAFVDGKWQQFVRP